MHFSLANVPVTSSSRLPGVELAVLLLLLTPNLSQGQPNYQLAHEESLFVAARVAGAM